MNFIQLILTVCLSAQPNVCQEEHLQYTAEVTTPHQCTMGAMPYLAQWAGDHPKWTVQRWRCDYPGRKRDI
jgi:hypothetical protein